MSANPAEITVDVARWGQTVDRFAAATDRSHYDILQQQARLFVVDVVRLTAPMVNYAAAGESLASQRRAGLNAVKRDISRIFTPLEDLSLWNATDPHLRKEFRKFASAGNLPALRAVLWQATGTIKPEQVKDEAAIKAVHMNQRDSRGRVRRHVAHFFALKKPLNEYIKQRQQWVGLLKAGWGASAARLKVSLPAWIARQPVQGEIEVRLRSNNPFIRMINTVRYANTVRGQQSVNDALKRREQAMIRQIDAKMTGDWQKSGYHGKAA